MALKNDLHLIPFFRLLIFFIIGILTYEFWQLNMPSILVYLSISLLIIISYIKQYFSNFKYRWLFGIISAFTFIFFGNSFHYRNTKISNPQASIGKHNYIAKIISSPKEKERGTNYIIEIISIEKNSVWQKSSFKVNAFFLNSLDFSIKYGDIISVRTNLKRVINKGNPNEFDYAKYLSRKQIYYSCLIVSESYKKLNAKTNNSLKYYANKCQNKLLDILKASHLSSNAYQILGALCLGSKKNIDARTKKLWSEVGVIHILAVSGLHVGIIFMIINHILSFLKNIPKGNWLKLILIFSFLWFYALLTGLSPSVMRATIMFCFIAIGKCINRSGTVYNSLFISAFALLLYDTNILFSLGFQFSYLAVLSIVFFHKPMTSVYKGENKILKYLISFLAVSISAQIGTLALSIFYFHQFPTYFILANFIIVPLAAFIIYSSLLLLIFSFSDIIVSFLAYILNNTLELINLCFEYIRELKYSLIKDLYIDTIEVIILYFIIISIMYSMKFRNKLFIISILFSIIVIQINTEYKLHKNEFVIFNKGKYFTACHIVGNTAYVLTDSSNYKNDKILSNYLYNNNAEHIKYNWLSKLPIQQIGNKKILFLDNIPKQVILKEIINIDLVVLNKRLSIDHLEKLSSPLLISIRNSRNNEIVKRIESSGIKIHYLKTEGAYIE